MLFESGVGNIFGWLPWNVCPLLTIVALYHCAIATAFVVSNPLPVLLAECAPYEATRTLLLRCKQAMV